MEVVGWISLAPNGRRYHAVTKFDVYLVETACGMASAESARFSATEPAWDADVPSPPRMCPNCKREINAASPT